MTMSARRVPLSFVRDCMTVSPAFTLLYSTGFFHSHTRSELASPNEEDQPIHHECLRLSYSTAAAARARGGRAGRARSQPPCLVWLRFLSPSRPWPVGALFSLHSSILLQRAHSMLNLVINTKTDTSSTTALARKGGVNKMCS